MVVILAKRFWVLLSAEEGSGFGKRIWDGDWVSIDGLLSASAMELCEDWGNQG